MKKEIKILIIDDDVDFANYIFDVANNLNLKCQVTSTSEDFMRAYDDTVTLIFLDLNIPNIDGIELIRFIETKKIASDIILISGVDKRILESAKEFAITKGLAVVGHFQKPIRLKELEDILIKCTAPKTQTIDKTTDAHVKKIEISKESILKAIQDNEFVIFYQPKVEIKTQKLIGVETLIRWKHPQNGLIFPDQFISLAESYGLIDEITWIVIKNAVKELELIKQKIGYSLKISINLSPCSLQDLAFPDKLLKIINEAKITPENIILEVTESELLNKLTSALDIFTRLRLKNIHLSIDDFGTGYAMMQQLKSIPATEIKIDKSFVQSMLVSETSKVTVKKVIEIGHELGMQVVAEGVDTKEHLKALYELQCDMAQGYLYSKPIPIDDLVNWINYQFCKLEIS